MVACLHVERLLPERPAILVDARAHEDVERVVHLVPIEAERLHGPGEDLLLDV